jgi:ubiquinone/menaquinone biosynthesis C-methylase UbiE
LEFIDKGMLEGDYSLNEYYDNIQDMGIISKYLGSHYAQLSEFYKLDRVPDSILDFGCGAGSFSMILSNYFKKCRIIGIDTNPYAIEFAKSRLAPHLKVEFRMSNQNELVEPDDSVDVVTCSLLCHHIPKDEEILQFLKDTIRVSRDCVIIRDLERHPMAVMSYRFLMKPIFNNRLTIHDGELSIRRSFSRKEWENYLNLIGLKKNEFKILSKPIHQFIIVIYSKEIKKRMKL